MAQRYADAGRYAELLTYLEERPKDELEESAMLTLLCGIAHSRLGRLEVGQQWAMVAQLRARALKDRMMEVRALNVCGAIALERCARACAWLHGRDYVSPADIQALAPDVLRHRIVPSWEAQSAGDSVDALVAALIARVPVP